MATKTKAKHKLRLQMAYCGCPARAVQLCKLHAAAPELLDICRAILLAGGVSDNRVKQAIVKATGGNYHGI